MKKVLSVLLIVALSFSFAGCDPKEEIKGYFSNVDFSAITIPGSPFSGILGEREGTFADFQSVLKTEKDVNGNRKAYPLYGNDSYVVGLAYQGLDAQGLLDMNERYGSEGYLPSGCSITFADYEDGTTGAVRNMDLQISKNCAYELLIYPGENVTYPTWALAYTGADEKSYYEVMEEGISEERYAQIPYTATDAMSFGYNEEGDKACLYAACLMRAAEKDGDGNYLWTCSGTNPGAPIRCSTQSLCTLIATHCLTVEDALAYLGAMDENYNRLFPSIDPTLDVYTFNIEKEDVSNHWFEAIALEDSTGRHGVIEFIENRTIWHEGADYCFNFFLQEEYLYNPDGSYRESNGAGIGRMNATVPYLNEITNMEDHVHLMDGISYSHMTYYDEETGYTGRDWKGNPVDWRSEFTGFDCWATYDKFLSLGIDPSPADEKYSLYQTYIDTKTEEMLVVKDLNTWEENKDHLRSAYTMNFCLDQSNIEELNNMIRWNGALYNSLSNEEIRKTNSGWESYFRVIADPENFRVTRWFNEKITTADTYVFEELYKDQGLKLF